ncbi:MAG: DUF4214 domain-containing protein [Halomonas sp.]|nr:DUF4214 domain-containing protein [Halomonas sp.]MBL1266195.1 DUF4214 domain-containing protein [Halomonas sp.]
MELSGTELLVHKMYIAYYQRPADPEGLQYWVNQLEQNGDWSAVSAAFAASPENEALYGGLSRAQVIAEIYQSAFNREAAQSEIDFWASSEFSLTDLSFAIVNGAQNDDLATINNKVAYSAELADIVGNNANYGALSTDPKELLANVDKDSDVDTASVEASIQKGPGTTFTLTEATSTTTVEQTVNIDPTVETVIYWGNADTGEGVPASSVFGDEPLAGAMLQIIEGISADGLTELLEQIATITSAGVQDLLQGEGGLGDNVTMVDGDANTITVNGDGTITVTQTEDAKLGDYTGDYSIVLNITSSDVADNQLALTAQQFEYLSDMLFDDNGDSRLFEVEQETYPQVALRDAEGQVVRDANGDPVLVDLTQVTTSDGTQTTNTPIILTPNQNNGGTLEGGFTSGAANAIVAGRLDLLHQAYIDGGPGYDTLEVDAKGYFAQPLALLNIEQINVHNLPNIYGENSEGYPDFADATDVATASILDLSRATSLEKLVVTEGVYSDLENGEVQSGPITLTGIRAGAETTLDGGFSQNVTLTYGAVQGDGVDLVFNNLDLNASLTVAQNSETLNIEATGGNNYVGNANFGGQLNTLNISGDAHLFIDGDLDTSFRDGTPVTIDASENTGGVTLELSGSQEVTFLGSQADDRVQLQAVSAVTLEGNGGDNVYSVETETATVTVLDGNNQLTVDAEDVTVTAGDGDNTITAEDATTVVVATGNGDNTISTDDSESVTITTGTGDDTISSLNSESVTITSEGGDNTIDVSADEMAITTGDGNDTITVSGVTPDDIGGDGDNMALVNITTGAGDDTVVLGREGNGITALEGSSISGENITLVVENQSDLRAAELSGISSVVLDYDISDTINEDVPGYGVAPALTLTDAQFLAIGAENFNVNGAAFDNYAQIKIIVTESTSLTDLGVDALPSGIDLQLEIRDGATLSMTAEQLHTKVAPQGVTLADDNNTDQASGKVLITDAGIDFDPFNTNDGVRTDIDGEVYYGGSLSSDFWDDANSNGEIEQGEWGSNVKLDAELNGYNRPADEPSYSRIVIDTDSMDGDLGPFSTFHTFLRMVGSEDLTFTPVEGGRDEWGAPIQGGTAIELGVGGEEFIIDFSSVTGDVQNLAIARFEDAAEIYGNGNGVRLNVELTGDVGSADEGLFSRDVPTYVVTDLNGEDREFWTCETTQDLETLGLQGNYGDTITFGNTERGVEFLMEVAYSKADGYSVGSVNGVFARGEGATATFNVVGLSDLPAGEQQVVGGIDTNATSAVVNIDGGNTVIEALAGTDLESLTLTADGDVEVEGGLPAQLESIDATGIDGSFTAAFEPAGDFTFEGAQAGSELTLEGTFEATDATSIDGGSAGMTLVIDGSADITLEDATLANINTVVLEEGAELNITFAQAIEIGAENFVLADDANPANGATLNLSGLGEEPFALADFAEGINVDVVTIADQPEVTLNPATDLTGIANLQVPEGTILNLTAAQFQQLTDGEITGIDAEGNPTTDFTVNITDLTQADVDNGIDLSGITADNTTLTLAEDVTVPAEDGAAVPPVVATDLGTFEINIGGFTFTLPLITQADGLTITGEAGSVLAFTDVTAYDTTSSTGNDGIDASGFDVEILKALNVLVDDQNIEQLFEGLDSEVTVEIYNDLGFLQPVFRTVVVNEGTTVPGFVAFNDIGDASELRTLDLTLMGGTEISGNLDLTNTAGTDQNLIPQRFQTLTINSEGTAENLLNGETANVITGNITATPASTPDVDPSEENNLKNVVINASQDFVLEGDLVFSSVSDDTRFEATNDDAATVTLEINGDADVSIQQIDVTDPDIDTLVINNAGSGTLTVTGASPAINGDGGELETLTLEGTGDIVFGTDGEGITSATVSTIDASALSGDLTLGEVTDVDSADFAFTAGSGVTTMTLTTDELNADVNADPAESGWSIDYTNAAAGSELRLGEDLDFTAGPLSINMGTNGTLYIDADTDLTALDLTLLGDQPIVVADGVELTLTAAQASGLNIIGENGVDSTGVVTITELGEEPVDLSGIQTELAGNVTLAEDSVALDAATDLGNFTVLLDGATAQLIGFATEEQADGQAVEATGTGEHSIAWLFNALVNKPLDASNYDGDITRLYINDQLVVSDPDIESYYEGLSQLIEIINIQFTGDLDDLLETIALQRTFEVQAYADLENGLALVDGDDQRFLENIDIEMGGQVTIGDISLDNIIGTDVEGDDSFGTLTISSELFDFDAPHGPGNALAPQEWAGDGSQVTPDAINTIGNISSGTGQELFNVVLNTGTASDEANGESGAELSIQTITFDREADDAGAANLTLNGANDITVKALEAGDNVTSVNLQGTFTGTLDVTGGSPAIFGDELVNITIGNIAEDNNDGGFNYPTINIGNDAGDVEPGVVSSVLETFDASSFLGDLNVQISEVSQDFTFTSGGFGNGNLGGETIVTLNGENLALETGGEWTFNMANAGEGSQLVFTDAVALNGGTLNINLGSETMLVAGDVDFSALDELNITGNIDVAEGASITLTAEQADTLSITGEGEVFITELGADAVDLSGIQNTGGGTITLADEAAITLDPATVLTGALELQIGDTDLSLSAAQMMVQGPDVVEEVGLTITGATGTVNVTDYAGDVAADLDLSNVQTAIAGTLILSGDAVASEDTDFGDFAIDIGANALTATAAQLDGVTVNNDAGGHVQVTNLEATPSADLSNVLTADGNESLVDAELATTAGETITLTAENLGVANVIISGEGTVDVTGTFVDYDRDEDGEIDTVGGETASFVVGTGATLELTAEQANDREVLASDGEVNVGTLNIGDLGQGPADIDLSNIDLDILASADVATDLTLASDADLGQVGEGEGVLFTVEEGVTFALNSRQADEQRIEGEGSALIDTVGQQVRSVDITAADSNAGQQSITINYTLNGVAGAVTVNNSVTNFTDVGAILTAFEQAFTGVDGIEATDILSGNNAGPFDNLELGNLALIADPELAFTVDSIDVVNGGSTLAAEESGNLLALDDTLETVATAEKTVTFDQNVLFQGNLGGSTEQVLTLDGEGQFILFGTFTNQPAELVLVATAELYMGADANASGLNVSGDGVLRLAEVDGGNAGIDLSGIAVDTVLELDGAVTFTGDFNTTAQVTVEDGALDISGLDDATNTVPANLPGSFVVAEGAAVRMTQEQGNELAASGEGDVVIELSDFGNNPDVDNNADFSGITADTQLDLSADVIFGGSIGATNVTVSGSSTLTLFSTADVASVETFTVNTGATLELSAAQANGLTIDGEGSVVITDLADTLDANLSNITASTTIELEGDSPAAELAFTGELNANTDVVFAVDADDVELDITGATVPAFNDNVNEGPLAEAQFTVDSGVMLILSEAQADGRTIDGGGAATVALDGDSSANLSNVSVDLTLALSADSTFDGQLPTGTVTVEGAFELDVTEVTNALPDFVVDAGATLTLTAAQASGLIVTGDGNVVITGLESTLGADLNGITAATTLVLTEDVTLASTATLPMAAVTLEGAFTLDASALTAFDAESIEVPTGATVVVDESQVGNTEGLEITGNGDARVVIPDTGTLSAAISNADLSNISAATTIVVSDGDGTVFIGTFNAAEAITLEGDAGALGDETLNIISAQNLPASIVLDGVNLQATAAQLNGLTVTGASSVTVVDLDETPAADLSGIADNLPVTIDLGAETVEFTGEIGGVDLTVNGSGTLDVTGATTFGASSVTVGENLTLTLDGSQLTGTTIDGDGTVNLVGDVAAADVTPLLTPDSDLAEIVLTDATSLTGSAADLVLVLDNVTLDSATNINITATTLASVTQANTLAAAGTTGAVEYGIQDNLTAVINSATAVSAGDRAGVVEAGTITITGLASGNEDVSFGGLSDTTAATSIDFTDNDNAATLTQAQLLDIANVGLSLTAADAITVTGVTEAQFEAVTDELDDNDTVDLGEAVTLAAVDFNDAFGSTGKGISATAGDDITVTMANVAVAGTAADDTFDFAGTETGANVTDFGTAGTDTIDLSDAATAGLGALADSGDGSIAAMTLNEAYIVAALDSAADGIDASDANDVIAGLAAIDADGAGFAGSTTDTAYIIATDANISAIWAYAEAGTDGAQAGELTLIGTVDQVLSSGDLAFA